MSKFNSIAVGMIATALFAFVSRQQIESKQKADEPKKGVKNITVSAIMDAVIIDAKGVLALAEKFTLERLNPPVIG